MICSRLELVPRRRRRMAKKHKKFKDKRLISPKKIRRWLFRLALVGIGVAAGVLARPSLIQDPVKRAQVEDIRSQVLQANDEAQQKAMEVLGQSSEVVKQTVTTVSEVTKEVTNKDPQVVVQETVTKLTEEVKTLPQEQVKKIKLQFCQDVIGEIELTCKNE